MRHTEGMQRARASWPSRIGSVAAILGVLCLVIWAVTGAGYFWPAWVWLGLATPFAYDRSIRAAWRRARRRPLGVNGAVCGVTALVCLAVWVITGAGYYFWPIWPALGLGLGVALHAGLAPGSSREVAALTERVGALTRSRRGVVDYHAAELRRVERDLHDGAQARLVALGMSLGMAEELLERDPAEARRLLADARGSAGGALKDLRDLVRGIHPPVLADRGLDGAVRALALTVPLPVEVSTDLAGVRLPAPLEAATYFAVAEALANVVKHSEASSAWIDLRLADGALRIVVTDDGHGGADPARGSGLAGIERRLAAFDGVVAVVSPPGGPTVVSLEVPCEPS